MRRQARIVDLADPVVALEELRDGLRIPDVLRDAQRQRLEAAAERVGRLGVHDRPHQPARLLDRRDERRRAGHHTASHVAVAVEVLRRALHGQVDPEGERQLIDRAGERVVDD